VALGAGTSTTLIASAVFGAVQLNGSGIFVRDIITLGLALALGVLTSLAVRAVLDEGTAEVQVPTPMPGSEADACRRRGRRTPGYNAGR
jgi:hypothetical protein